jgi:hypothetical protein
MSQTLKLLGATLNSSSPSVADFSNFSKFIISTSNDSDAAASNSSVDAKITTAISNATPSINNPTLSGTVTLSSLNTSGILHNDSNGVITSSKIKSGDIDTGSILYTHLDATVTSAFNKALTTSNSTPTSTSGILGDIIVVPSTNSLYICTVSAVDSSGAVWKVVQLSSI